MKNKIATQNDSSAKDNCPTNPPSATSPDSALDEMSRTFDELFDGKPVTVKTPDEIQSIPAETKPQQAQEECSPRSVHHRLGDLCPIGLDACELSVWDTYDSDWFCCEVHKVRWCIGENENTCRYQQEDIWASNEELLREFRIVEPFYAPGESQPHQGKAEGNIEQQIPPEKKFFGLEPCTKKELAQHRLRSKAKALKERFPSPCCQSSIDVEFQMGGEELLSMDEKGNVFFREKMDVTDVLYTCVECGKYIKNEKLVEYASQLDELRRLQELARN